MSLTTFLLVGLGGACGALCRHKALTFLKPKAAGPFPWPTLLVNLVSCTIAGAALAGCLAMGQMAYTALTMGFLGGFSTLSTMNCEAVDLAGEGRRVRGGSLRCRHVRVDAWGGGRRVRRRIRIIVGAASEFAGRPPRSCFLRRKGGCWSRAGW